MFRKPVASGGIPARDESRCSGWFKPLAAISALALAGAVTVGSAQAADLYAPRESLKDAPSAPGPRACALFQGFYIGGHAGSASYDWSWDDRDAWAASRGALPHSVSDTESGFIGGVQGGFNWQRGCTVFGLEADWSWADLDGTERHTDGINSASLTVASDVGGFGTVRMRSGVVVDSLLIYATGGFAFADIERDWTVVKASSLPETFSSDDRRWGWTAGVGAEWAIADRISLKSEALYLRFEDDTFRRTSGGDNKLFDHEDAVWVGRLGLNVRLGSAGGPVPH
jgi:outer membrane immunogenic protein